MKLLLRRSLWVACGFWITSMAAYAAVPAPGAERADLAPPPVKASADKAQSLATPAKSDAATHDAAIIGRDAIDDPFGRLQEMVIKAAALPTPPAMIVPPENHEPATGVVPGVWKSPAMLLPSPAATNTVGDYNNPFDRLLAATSDNSHASSPNLPSPGVVIPVGAQASAPTQAVPPLPLPRVVETGPVAPLPEPPPAPPAAFVPPAPAVPAPAPAPQPQVAAPETPAPPAAVAVSAGSPTLAADLGKAGDLGGPRQSTDGLLYLIVAQTFAILAVGIIGPLAFLLALDYVLRRRGLSLGSLFKVEVVNNNVIPSLTAAPNPPAARTAPAPEHGEPTTARPFNLGPTFEEDQQLLEEASHRAAEAMHRTVFEQNVQLTEQLDGIEEEEADSAIDPAEPHAHLRKQVRDLAFYLEKELRENKDEPPFPNYVYEEDSAMDEPEGGAMNGQAPADVPTCEAPERRGE